MTHFHGQERFTPHEMPVPPLAGDICHIVGIAPTIIVKPADRKTLMVWADVGAFRIRLGPYGNQTIASFANATDQLTLVDHDYQNAHGPLRMHLDFARATQNAQGLTPTKPETVLTITGQPTDTNTVVLGGKTYTYQTTLTDVDGNVQIGASAAISLANLAKAINLTGVAGTDYATSMTIHADVWPASWDATTLTLRGDVEGTSQNTLVSTETHALGSFPGATFASGTPGVAALEYYPIVTTALGADIFKLAASKADALAGTAVAFTTDGTLAEVIIEGMPTIEQPTVTDLTSGEGGLYVSATGANLGLQLPGPTHVSVRGYDSADVLTFYWV